MLQPRQPYVTKCLLGEKRLEQQKERSGAYELWFSTFHEPQPNLDEMELEATARGDRQRDTDAHSYGSQPYGLSAQSDM